MKTLVLEASKLGGKAKDAHWVENYPGFPKGLKGQELVDKFTAQAEKFGAKFKFETVIGINVYDEIKMVSTRQGFHQAKAIIIATGVTRKQLKVPGENEFKGRGVSYCAVCDGPFFNDKIVAVYGSGLEAVHDTEILSESAKKVYAIPGIQGYSEDYEELKRIKENPKIEIIERSDISEIGGEDLVSYLMFKGEKEKLAVDGVFIILEHVSTSNIVSEIGIEVDGGGCIITKNTQETNIKGIYAAGDCSCRGMQIVTAAGMGANASLSAMKYVKSLSK
jgi:thioredoxin reductase (NADPH)